MSLLGIDVGTTGCKVVAFSLDGEVLSEAYGEYPLIHRRVGFSELDSEGVWIAVLDGIHRVAESTVNDPIEALAVGCQGEAFTPVDAKGHCLQHGITTFDFRAREDELAIGNALERLAIMRITGMPLSAIATLCKLRWLRRECPEIYCEAWKFLSYEELVFQRLGVDPVIDYSMAARTMAFDINAKDWSSTMLEVAEVDREKLPDVAPSGTVVGKIGPAAARMTGLPVGAVVVTGGHDQPCGALGAGITQPGRVMDATGTVECIAPALSRPVVNQQMLQGNFSCYPHVLPDLYISLGFVSSGGVSLRWFRDQFGGDDVREAERRGVNVYDFLMASMPERPSGLLFLPHLTGAGTPTLDLGSKGAILGLTLSSTRAELVKAVIEGISFEIRHNLDLLEAAGVEIGEVRAIGGGARSERWLQLKADIFGKSVVALNVSEGVCLGAAMLAGIAIGRFESADEAVARFVTEKKTYHPRPEVQGFYEERMGLFRSFYPATRQLSRDL